MFPIASMHFFMMVLLFERLLFFSIMCACVWISAHGHSACRSQKKVMDLLKLKLHKVGIPSLRWMLGIRPRCSVRAVCTLTPGDITATPILLV